MHSWLPEGVSTYSGSIDHMFYMILWVTGIGFIVTEVVLFAFAFMYRSRPGRRATYTHGNGKLEILKLRDDYRKQEGDKFSLQKFNDEILRHGCPPIRLLREVLLKDAARWNEVF